MDSDYHRVDQTDSTKLYFFFSVMSAAHSAHRRERDNILGVKVLDCLFKRQSGAEHHWRGHALYFREGRPEGLLLAFIAT